MLRPRRPAVLLALGLGLLTAGPARAQCMLANPSFELAGSSGAVFAGWSQFGAVGASIAASHGAVAARVSGPNTGGWDVSGFWQPLDTTPGQRWTATLSVRNPSTRPLTGACAAIVNFEWRDAAGSLISYESHTVADAATPRDTSLRVTIASGPAPAGTAKVRLLLGVLQSPTDPSPDVVYDQVTLVAQTVPSLDQKQWSDFPGGGTLDFSGYTWRVKGPGYYGPGPSLFSDAGDAVWVDADGHLHLTIHKVGSSWYSTEVALTEALGYGDYVFTTLGRLDTLDPTTVLGLFLWEYGPCYDDAFLWWNPDNEFDIEFSRWGVAGSPVAQYVAQPADYPGNRHRFDMTFQDGEETTHAFRWLADRVECRSWRGGPADETPASTIQSWTYRGPHIPRPDQPRVHLNLWQNGGPPPVAQEAVLSHFGFISADPSLVDVPTGRALSPTGVALAVAGPNPSVGGTRLRLALPEPDDVRLTLYNVAGRPVRTLLAGAVAAGERTVSWDGRDAAGAPAPSGLYFARVTTTHGAATARFIVLQ